MYSPSINKLIKAFKRLPSVGERTAERFIFYLLKSGKKEVTELMLTLKDLIENVKSCEVCWNFSDTSPCAICNNPKRDQTTLCVVADVPDVQVIEKTGYQGMYHVLRHLFDAGDEGVMLKMKYKELLERLKKKTTKEIILALNPDLAGETTMLFLEREIKTAAPEIKITRLARGLPMGADLRYADEITLASAIKNRLSKQ